MKLWVIDTNVVVSAMLVSDSPPARIIAAVGEGRIEIAYDARIRAEYREVLNRPHLRISPIVIANFLASLHSQKEVTTTHRLAHGPDPDDLMFIEVALETQQKTIVTGNLKDYPPAMDAIIYALDELLYSDTAAQMPKPDRALIKSFLVQEKLENYDHGTRTIGRLCSVAAYWNSFDSKNEGKSWFRLNLISRFMWGKMGGLR